ncbi:MAG: aromatic aminobenezylarsenical efflux permease ArsG family transporter [Candidatus Latescibacter sp.]|nr:aromatic aminobenezylarsenical efflux permease ArsG family transporter [Candidatus Latescibacter sp.]
MESPLTGIVTALWLGVLTSLSPCPLTTNIAAISFIGKRVGNIGSVLFSGLTYTAGRVLTYLVIGIITVTGLLSIPVISFFLQQNMGKILGPLLFLTGVLMLGIIPLNLIWTGVNVNGERFAKRTDAWSAGFMGIVFALAFCPVSAALFFGSLIPLAVKQGSPVAMPVLYGIGTGLPVLLFAVLLAFSAKSVGKAFHLLNHFERWARRITGMVLIVVGIYLSMQNIFGVTMP